MRLAVSANPKLAPMAETCLQLLGGPSGDVGLTEAALITMMITSYHFVFQSFFYVITFLLHGFQHHFT